MRYHRLLLAATTLALSGCATEAKRPLTERAIAPLTGEQFRTLFPVDDKAVDAALQDYNMAQAVFLKKSENGARETVSLLTADGHVHSGYDELFSAGEKGLREVRDDYVAIQVGNTSCVQTTERKKCLQGNALHLGLVDIEKSHVSRAWSKDLFCFDPAVACRFIKIQLGSAESDINSYDGYSSDPELVGHDVEVLFTMPEHVPIYYKQTDHYHIGVTATAFYSFQFDNPIRRIELPKEDESISRD